MSGQSFVAYRQDADHFEIVFFGGPLDGSRVLTDVFPKSETFAHRLHQRSYLYTYQQVETKVFHAHHSGFGTEAGAMSDGNLQSPSFLGRWLNQFRYRVTEKDIRELLEQRGWIGPTIVN